MPFLVNKSVRVTEIVKPGGWRALLKEPRIAALGESFKRAGNIALPVLRKSTMEIVAGKDRIAAHDSLGAEWVEVRLWEGTDLEMRQVRADENLQRRQFTESEREAMRADVEAKAGAIRTRSEKVQEAETVQDTHQRGAAQIGHRKRTPEREAMREVAAEHGVTERAVEKAIAKPVPAKPTGPQMPDAALLLQAGLAGVRATAARAMAQLTDLLKKLPDAYAEGADLALLHRHFKHAATQTKMAQPERLCPYCKAQKKHTKDCPACKGLGYLTPAQGSDVPKELLVEGDGAGIYVGKKFVRLADL